MRCARVREVDLEWPFELIEVNFVAQTKVGCRNTMSKRRFRDFDLDVPPAHSSKLDSF